MHFRPWDFFLKKNFLEIILVYERNCNFSVNVRHIMMAKDTPLKSIKKFSFRTTHLMLIKGEFALFKFEACGEKIGKTLQFLLPIDDGSAVFFVDGTYIVMICWCNESCSNFLLLFTIMFL